MTLEEIHDNWQEDSKIDKSRLSEESLKVHELHHKYLKLFSAERTILKKLKIRHQQLEAQLEDYYGGTLDGKEIGRPPFQRVLNTAGVKKMVANDPEIIKMNLAMANAEEKVLVLKDIVDAVRFRGNVIKNFIDWMKWTSGEG